jgi:hypothetical protein
VGRRGEKERRDKGRKAETKDKGERRVNKNNKIDHYK